MKNIRRDEVDDLTEDKVYCFRCFCAMLNIHPIANAMNEWDAIELKLSKRKEIFTILMKGLNVAVLLFSLII